MLLYHLLFAIFVFLFFIVSALSPATDIVPENQALTQLTNNVDTDVYEKDVVDMVLIPQSPNLFST